MNNNDRYKWIEYKNQKILYTDYSKLNENDVRELAISVGNYINSLKITSIKQLIKGSDVELNSESISAVENFNLDKNVKIKRKIAVLDISLYVKTLTDFWNNTLYKDKLKFCIFDDKSEALEWLIQDY